MPQNARLAIIVVYCQQQWANLGLLSKGHIEAEQRQAQNEIDTWSDKTATSLTKENIFAIVSILLLVDELAKSADNRPSFRKIAIQIR